MKRWQMIGLAPLGLSIIVLVLTVVGQGIDTILFLRIDLVTLSLVSSCVIAMLTVASWLSWRSVTQIQERRIAQFQAQAADERRRFFGRLDHELKNPLMAIRAGIANLSTAPTADRRDETINSITSQTVRLSRLASDLRKLTELETRSIEMTPVDVATMLQEVVTQFEDNKDMEDRQINLSIQHIPWTLSHVLGDYDLIYLTIYNLIDNAFKFTQPADTIEIRAFEDRRYVMVEIADTGIGIPSDETTHVWEELYRGKTARATSGSGLGLALVRSVVLRHGGDVALRSRLDQGTVVTVRLPRHQVTDS